MPSGFAPDMLARMFRAAVIFALAWPFAALAATAPEPGPAEAQYRSRRQAALAAQWMEIKLPFETPAQFLARLLDTARDGDPRGTAALGWEFQQRGDAGRARMWLGRSAERGNPFAAYILGLLAAKDGTPPDPAAPDWMQRAADAGLPDAQFEIALRHARAKEDVVARGWYERAAEQHYPPALCNLASMELLGAAGSTDLRRAEEHFRDACKAGFPQGFFGLGEALRLQGHLAEAVAPYEEAAEAGIAQADFWLGCFALQLPGRPRDEKKAATHFLHAALGGQVIAQAIAADFLRHGTGVAEDADAAARWDQEIGKITDPQVVATLGGLFLEGKLVRRDPVRALGFFRLAAEQGQPAAQRWAGTLLATGEAGETNLQEAYQWLWLASRNGQPDAEAAFQSLLKAMSGEQIIDAARRTERFQAARGQAP